MKLRRQRTQLKTPKVVISNDEIMRDLLFPAVPRERRDGGRAAVRR